MPEDRVPCDYSHCFYLTKEQIQRLAALTLDSLVGAQIRTDADDRSFALIDMVMIDDPNNTEHFEVYTDGSYLKTT